MARVFAGLSQEPSITELAKARKELTPYRRAPHLVGLRLACVASFTIDPLRTALELQLLRAGFAPELYIAPFGQFEQQLLNPASELASFAADVVLCAIRLKDVCPAIYDSYNGLAPEPARTMIEDWLVRLSGGIRAFRGRSPAKIMLQNYELPSHVAMGPADSVSGHSQVQLIQEANQRLGEIARSFDDVYMMDHDALLARHGRSKWADPRMELYARIAVAPANYWRWAGFFSRHLRPLYGLSKKMLCLDADNTLWGGVIGDVGVEGIQLGHDYPGNAYVALQKAVLDLYHRGVLLCLNSKNDEANVLEVLDRHPDMILRREHFAAMRINWDPKPENLQSLAAELNLGLDSFVFVDDHPIECELVREALPEVLCVQLPSEPAHFEETIRGLDCFDQWNITSEDRKRGQLYRAETRRRELATAAMDMATFYRQLQMSMTISVDNPMHAGRVAQMTHRTNQFNMNTIRCSEDEIRHWMKAPDFHVMTLDLADRFGDNGIVGVAILKKEPIWHLHMLLMSCRVLGRTVEQTFIRWIARRARSAGALRLMAAYVPTGKNKPFAEFYGSCGFTRADNEGHLWSMDLERADLSLPEYISLTERQAPEQQ